MHTLLTIPREIRDHIFEYVLDLAYPDNVVWSKDHHCPSDDTVNIPKLQKAKHLALLRTNRQVYFEATEIFYSSNTFTLVQGAKSLMGLSRVHQTGAAIVESLESSATTVLETTKIKVALTVTCNIRSSDRQTKQIDTEDEDTWTIIVTQRESRRLARYFLIEKLPSEDRKGSFVQVNVELPEICPINKKSRVSVNTWLLRTWIVPYEVKYTGTYKGQTRVLDTKKLKLGLMKWRVSEYMRDLDKGTPALSPYAVAYAIRRIFTSLGSAWIKVGGALGDVLRAEDEIFYLEAYDKCISLFGSHFRRHQGTGSRRPRKYRGLVDSWKQWRTTQDKQALAALIHEIPRREHINHLIPSMMALSMRKGSSIDPMAWAMARAIFVKLGSNTPRRAPSHPKFRWHLGEAEKVLRNRVDLSQLQLHA
ncbi:MAG: hypothetical protein M1820_009887 [Bogoriella megaspora]|nr:MAG: hypothetical protein M1820_009887 [Bogoriella megaspora]